MKQPGLLWLPRSVRCGLTLLPASKLMAVLQVTQLGHTVLAYQLSGHLNSRSAQPYLEPFRGMQPAVHFV